MIMAERKSIRFKHLITEILYYLWRFELFCATHLEKLIWIGKITSEYKYNNIPLKVLSQKNCTIWKQEIIEYVLKKLWKWNPCEVLLTALSFMY